MKTFILLGTIFLSSLAHAENFQSHMRCELWVPGENVTDFELKEEHGELPNGPFFVFTAEGNGYLGRLLEDKSGYLLQMQRGSEPKVSRYGSFNEISRDPDQPTHMMEFEDSDGDILVYVTCFVKD